MQNTAGGNATPELASLNPDDASEGGGYLDNALATIIDAKVIVYTFPNSIYGPSTCLAVEYDAPEAGQKTVQYYTAAKPENFVPTADNKGFARVGKSTQLSTDSNAMFFLGKLVAAGFPKNKLGNDVSVLIGTKALVGQVPKSEKATGQPAAAGQPANKPKTVLVPLKVVKLPWETSEVPLQGGQNPTVAHTVPSVIQQPAASTPLPSVAQGGAQPAAQGNNALDEQAQGVTFQLILANGGSIQKAQLPQKAFMELAKDPNRNALVQMISQDAFLLAAGRPWKYADGIVSLG